MTPGGRPAGEEFQHTGKPVTVKRKHTAAVMTKAITWLLVKADSAAPMARNAPAIRKLPR